MSRVPTPKVSVPGLKLPKPKIKLPDLSKPEIKPDGALKAIGHAAGEVAQRTQRVGAIAAEVQRASEAIGNRSDD
jgi:hypothetical protein